MYNFLHTFQPSPVLLALGPVIIYWYGFFIVFGIIFSIVIALKLATYYNIKKNLIIDLAFWIVLAGIAGARIYHVLLELPYYLDNPFDIVKIWQGGLAIHGAIIAGLIVIWAYAKQLARTEKNQTAEENFWLISSLITPGLALAQAIGRWGNYFNQELFGAPTNLPWGIPINPLNRPAEYFSFQYFHPTFLYESLGNFLIFAILVSIHIFIIKKHKPPHLDPRAKISSAGARWDDCAKSVECSGCEGKQNNVKWHMGCAVCYAILYSILRFFLEFIKIDQTPVILGLRFPQFASLIIIAAAVLLLLKNKKKYDTL